VVTLIKILNANGSAALPGNSPMFYGRVDELYSILGFLRHPDQSGNVSVVGERRIGKSSLLNQVCQALTVDANVITISTILSTFINLTFIISC